MEKTTRIGTAIRRVRKSQGLTQEQLAATAGVGVRFIRELEQGKASCHLGKVLHVCMMLGMSVHIDGEVL